MKVMSKENKYVSKPYIIAENQRDKKHLFGSCPYNEESTIDVLIR